MKPEKTYVNPIHELLLKEFFNIQTVTMELRHLMLTAALQAKEVYLVRNLQNCKVSEENTALIRNDIRKDHQKLIEILCPSEDSPTQKSPAK